MSGSGQWHDSAEVTALSTSVLDAAVRNAEKDFAEASTLEDLAQVKGTHLSDRSTLFLARRSLGTLPSQERAAAGRRVNDALGAVQSAYTARAETLSAERDARVLRDEAVDVTLPWNRSPVGARHPITTIQERLADVFVAMGYEVAEGPEVEAEWFNFDALNIGRDHPARSMMDTFYVAPQGSELVLRAHTSPVQVRVMLARKPPIFVVCPGKVFRTDEVDATHTPVFQQIEGLAVDEGITMAHLRGTLDHLAETMFGEGLQTRWRPSYFPFTEPSAEFDVQCFVCRGASVGNPDAPCRTCSSEGWIEWGGAGMVNPRVFIACGIDPERYTGFAFGLGVGRTLQFRHGVSDARHLVEGDVRFTLPFGTQL